MPDELLIKKIKNSKRGTRGGMIFLVMFITGFVLGTSASSQYSRGEILFSVAYSSEKHKWIEEIKPLFLDWYGENYPNDTGIKLNFFSVGSRESIIALLNGQYQPAIWSPAASTWIPYLNYLWREEHQTAENITTINKTVFYSPVVGAIWNSTQVNYNITSLEGIYNLTKLESSPIKLAHTDPRLSNSGFCTVIMEVAAAAGKNSSQLTYADLSNNTIREWVKQFESASVQYGKSTGYLIKAMIQSGPNAITTAFLYESLIIDYGEEGEAEWGDRIVPIYPAEGSIHSDHPFCLLDGAPWMKPEVQQVALRFLDFIGELEALEIAANRGFRLYNTSIPLPVDKFNESNGIMVNLMNPKMEVPEDDEFLYRVEDLWLWSRPTF
ncbi:MAG: substrate-binding domain-containing protein [Promethearchaeota archaeon]